MIYVIIILIDALVGLWIGHSKGRDVAGLVLGGLLGILGWIITAFLSPSHDVLVRREIGRRSVAHDAAQAIAQTPNLDGMDVLDVRSMSPQEARAYVKNGTVPPRLTVPADVSLQDHVNQLERDATRKAEQS